MLALIRECQRKRYIRDESTSAEMAQANQCHLYQLHTSFSSNPHVLWRKQFFSWILIWNIFGVLNEKLSWVKFCYIMLTHFHQMILNKDILNKDIWQTLIQPDELCLMIWTVKKGLWLTKCTEIIRFHCPKRAPRRDSFWGHCFVVVKKIASVLKYAILCQCCLNFCYPLSKSEEV